MPREGLVSCHKNVCDQELVLAAESSLRWWTRLVREMVGVEEDKVCAMQKNAHSLEAPQASESVP